ncbi:MAG TPA: metalloregulator ArsR/SmtB family transcription factor [Ramlibacter sp.]|uniref:ArsR/SmtB family transcription factor n=1 Tax=Ramlibacter sp. TaxID=1917967 RepID=UPI002ED5D0CB
MTGDAVLDQVFWALSDSTRRSVIEHLTRGPATVSDLAQPHAMSLPGFMKHLKVLEDAGLLVRAKEGRSVRCELAPRALEDAAMWLAHYEKFWTAQLDALGRYLYHQEEVQAWKPARSTTGPRSGSSAATPSPRKKSGGPGRTRRR